MDYPIGQVLKGYKLLQFTNSNVGDIDAIIPVLILDFETTTAYGLLNRVFIKSLGYPQKTEDLNCFLGEKLDSVDLVDSDCPVWHFESGTLNLWRIEYFAASLDN